ncbi:IPT/TIG domain-containing protein [Gloeobacter morelensis]|uniref:Hint domain-containing protein n=1 Tax=Gloeobacter morelensis MG652769 TaxID=2781736 RepID=A0ABY3PRA0_9CYAN|nr:IPT/TIG domain-containing protein [Gloeobacter morelensis]UFP96139.1 hypothetical protein ISF26_08010 [Gloeobacter morelensis MG652769]
MPENTSFEAYNSFGQVERVVDGQGRVTEFDYYNSTNYVGAGTANQDPHFVRYPSGLEVCFRYDTLSRLKAVFYCYQFEQTNRWTEYTYDKLNRLTTITGPSDASNTRRTTEFTYDDNSNVTSVKASNGVLTTYTYDPMDRVASRTQAGRTENFSYNNLGLLSKYKSARGQETLYEYGSKQRLRYVTFADSTKLTYSYNTLDQVASITDSSDASGARNVYFEYFTGTDQVSRLKTERIGTGEIVRYYYDASGNLTSIKKGTSDAIATPLINYDYKDDDASLDAAGLCGNSTCDQNNAVVGFEYDPDGSLKSISYPNSVKEELFYNDGGEVERALFSGPGGTLLREIEYQYDYSTRGYLTARSESGPSTPSVATSQSYSYNEAGELTGATTPAGNYTNAYDKDGNLTSSSRPGASTTPSYEAGTNRMTAFEGGTLIYDASGNLVEQNVGSTKVTFTYNARNQLSGYTNNAGFSVSFVYDALGRRMRKTVSGTTTSYLLSGNQVIEQKTGSATKRYLVGLGLDEVFISREGSTDEYLLHDPLNNSVVATVNGSTKAIKTGYGYSPFGQMTASNTASSNLWLFTGAEAVNSASVVYHLRSRYYHAGNQRFMAEDPIGFAGGDTNLYRYLGNAPVTASDPTGLRPDLRPRGVATLPGLTDVPNRSALEAEKLSVQALPIPPQASESLLSDPPNSSAPRLAVPSAADPVAPAFGFASSQAVTQTVSGCDPDTTSDFGCKVLQGQTITTAKIYCRVGCSPENTISASPPTGLPANTSYSYQPANPFTNSNGVQLVIYTNQGGTTPPGSYTVTIGGYDQTNNNAVIQPIRIYLDVESNNAYFDEQRNVPSAIKTGQSVGVTVRMENPGTSTWDSFGNYKLCATNGNGNWGISCVPLYYQISETVEVDFNFTITAPSNPGTYGFQWQMYQDGYGSFGQVTPYTPIAVTAYPPTISSISPTSGLVGTSVTINGTNFQGVTAVKFNGTNAAYTVNSSTKITATVPSGASSGPINVTASGGSVNSGTFTVLYAPTVSSISPTSGGVGASVTISGTNFTGASSVKFNGTAAGFTVNSASQITATVPSGATSGSISVTTAGGTAYSGTFTVLAAPTVSSLSPTSGATGASVTISGTNFTGASAVKFNTTPATFAVVSASQISATVPSGATDGAVSVSTAGGTGTGGFFDVQATPSINSSGGVVGNPGSGVLSASASDTVLINGTNLNTLNSVTINGIAAYAVAVSATQIQVSLPENASTGPLVVKAAGVNLTASSSFKVNASAAPPSAHLDLVGVLGALQVLAEVGGLIPGLNVPSAILGIGVAAALGDAAGVLASGLALVPFGGFAKAGVGLFKARTGLSKGIVAASRACGCFAEGTEVQTETGSKAIEKVGPGEKVLARNEKTGEQSLRRVKSTFQFDNRPVYRLELRETDGDQDRDALTVTGEHPFFLQDKGWTAAEKLHAGDQVQAAGGQWLRVAGLQAQEQRQRTYNLEVEGDHSFFVGDTHAWVHNECPFFEAVVKFNPTSKGDVLVVPGGREIAKSLFRELTATEGRFRFTDKTGGGRGIGGTLENNTPIRIRFKPDGTTRIQVGKNKYVFPKDLK